MVCILSFIVKNKAMRKVTENSQNNAWNLNFSNGNVNNNNKKNSNRVRPVCELIGEL
jgi:hypothetical protein